MTETKYYIIYRRTGEAVCYYTDFDKALKMKICLGPKFRLWWDESERKTA